ncbi:MAG: hypothetical protein IJ100_08340 [Lachnospiraceae bacterium]|nr:hypothetical protein [Lachnospiraceae bacterium]
MLTSKDKRRAKRGNERAVFRMKEEIKQINVEEMEKVTGGRNTASNAVCEKHLEKGDETDWRDTPTFRPDGFGFPSM